MSSLLTLPEIPADTITIVFPVFYNIISIKIKPEFNPLERYCLSYNLDIIKQSIIPISVFEKHPDNFVKIMWDYGVCDFKEQNITDFVLINAILELYPEIYRGCKTLGLKRIHCLSKDTQHIE